MDRNNNTVSDRKRSRPKNGDLKINLRLASIQSGQGAYLVNQSEGERADLDKSPSLLAEPQPQKKLKGGNHLLSHSHTTGELAPRSTSSIKIPRKPKNKEKAVETITQGSEQLSERNEDNSNTTNNNFFQATSSQQMVDSARNDHQTSEKDVKLEDIDSSIPEDESESNQIEQRINTRPRHWELKWVRYANVWDSSDDIYIRRWVRENNTAEILVQPPTIRERESNKNHKCKYEECGKIFTDSNSLKKHMLVHGERQFVCSFEGCGKRFLDNSKLRRHQLVHTGEKPFKCEICFKSFSLDFNLRTHLRTHTGERPYYCKFPGCSKRFTQSSNLSAHEKTHNVRSENEEGNENQVETNMEEIETGF